MCLRTPTGLPRFHSWGGGGKSGGGGGDMRQQGSNLSGSSSNLRAEGTTANKVSLTACRDEPPVHATPGPSAGYLPEKMLST